MVILFSFLETRSHITQAGLKLPIVAKVGLALLILLLHLPSAGIVDVTCGATAGSNSVFDFSWTITPHSSGNLHYFDKGRHH